MHEVHIQARLDDQLVPVPLLAELAVQRVLHRQRQHIQPGPGADHVDRLVARRVVYWVREEEALGVAGGGRAEGVLEEEEEDEGGVQHGVRQFGAAFLLFEVVHLVDEALVYENQIVIYHGEHHVEAAILLVAVSERVQQDGSDRTD